MAKPRFRFSVLTLLGAVAVIAASLAAIRSASGISAGTAFMLAIFVLLFAVLGVALDRREMRRFWVAFSAFGWTYLILSCAPWFSAKVAPHLVTTELLHAIHPHVATVVSPMETAGEECIVVWVRSDASIWVDGAEVSDEKELVERLREIAQSTGKREARIYTNYYNPGLTKDWLADTNNRLFKAARSARVGGAGSATTTMAPQLHHFQKVCHALMALLLAFLGGLAAHWFFRRGGSAVEESSKAAV